MKEPYGEGRASHTGPESCAGVRKGAGEALTGAPAGRVSSREIPHFRVPTLSMQAEGHTGRLEHKARDGRTRRGRRPRACWDAPGAGTGRSRRWRRQGAGVRAVNPQGARRR